MIEYYKNLSLEDIEGEVWKDVPKYSGLYHASSFGRIKSFDKRVWNGVGYFIKKGRILKQNYYGRSNEYLMTGLSDNGITIQYPVHRLIGFAFIPNPENKPQINHKDGISLNNCVSNLEWNTNSENHRHAYIKLRRKSNLIAKSTGKNLIAKQVICKNLSGTTIAKFDSANIASENLGFPQQSISRHCISGTQYKNLFFEYAPNS